MQLKVVSGGCSARLKPNNHVSVYLHKLRPHPERTCLLFTDSSSGKAYQYSNGYLAIQSQCQAVESDGQQAETPMEILSSTAEAPLILETRRVALLSALGHATAGVAGTLYPKKADAFPSPSLESLQESAATASSRCSGESGISALRNPAIYRSVFDFLEALQNWY